MKTKKVFLFLLLASAAWLIHYFDVLQYLTLQSMQQNLDFLKSKFAIQPLSFTLGYFFIYVVTTALSLPGATLLTLLGGAIFGLKSGFVVVSFASTIGATVSFLLTRYFFKDYVTKKWPLIFNTINAGIKKEGAFYLFGLRLVPAFPFFIINMAMGLTQISVAKFYFVSQVAMIPGTLVYINAGKELSNITTVNGLLSPSLVFAFTLLGLFPLLAKLFLEKIKSLQIYKGYKKPKKFDYNIVVIGGGSAGLVTAYIAAAVKAKVALVEKNKMGGDCLNTGCIPSKALIKSARFLNNLKKSQELGIKKANADFNFEEIMQRIQKVIQQIEPHDSVERYTELGVDCFKNKAEIVSPWEVKVGERILKTKNIVIATGARPFVPPIPGLEDVAYVTSDTLWQIKTKPQKLLVVGGGAIGCELAQCFNALGTHVTILEQGNYIMGKEDADVAEFIENAFKSENISIFKNTKIVRFKNKNQVVVLHHNTETTLDFDLTLLATGRKANTFGFGLENLNIELNTNGTIAVNEHMQTNYKNIFACGDVAGPYQFTHAASHQAWFAAVNALFGTVKKFRINYQYLPWATFTSPEVARVGLSESDAQNQKTAYEVSKYNLSELDRAIADSTDKGFVKVLTKPNTDKILGVTIVAENASDMLPEFVTAMKHGLGLNKILGTIHAYPTMSEANKYVAGVWKKNHAPQGLLKFVEKFHKWSLKN